MDTLTKLQTIRNFESWAAAHKIDASPLALLEYLDSESKTPAPWAVPGTNYEKIKNMSLEELAAFLDEITTRCFNAGNSPGFRICADCPICGDTGHCYFDTWLMKEAD